MSQRTEDRLRAAFAARAERVTHADLRPARLPEPAPRKIGPWVAPLAVAAAVATVVAGGTLLLDRDVTTTPSPARSSLAQPTTAPSTTTSPSTATPTQRRTSLGVPSGIPVKGVIPLLELPRGADPRAVWVARGELHDGPRVIKLADTAGARGVSAVRAGDGYVVALTGTAKPRVSRVSVAGETVVDPVELLGGLRVSADGSRVAWAGTTVPGDSGSGGTTVVVADAATGAVVATHRVGHEARVGGFDLDRVLVDERQSGTFAWTPSTGRYVPFLAGWSVTHVNEATGMVSLVGHKENVPLTGVPAKPPTFAVCSAVAAVANPGKPLWQSCAYHVGAEFSPDGRSALLIDSLTDGEGVSGYVVADATTGRPGRLLAADFESDVVWEDDSTFLVSVVESVGHQEAIVRCTVDGRCERASDLLTGGSDIADPPVFSLGS